MFFPVQDGHEICFVGDEAFRELSKVDPNGDELLNTVSVASYFTTYCYWHSWRFRWRTMPNYASGEATRVRGKCDVLGMRADVNNSVWYYL